MAITVRATYEVQRGRDLRGGSKFGESRFIGTRVLSISASCGEIDRGGRTCQCQLTGVDIVVECLVRLNPQRIAVGFFDLDTQDAYTGRRRNGTVEPRQPDDVPLSEAAVLAHEESHCSDMAKAVEEAVQEALDRIEASLISQCACDRLQLCHQALRWMVETKIDALGTEAYERLLDEARRHYRGSETEQRARQVTADHLHSLDDDTNGGGNGEGQ